MPDLSERSRRREISVSVPVLTSSAILAITPSSPPFFTPYGSSLTTIARRQYLRLLARLVVVGAEVDRVGVDVAEELCRHAREPDLGVPHRRGRVAVNVPEVALPVDERVAHRERLRETDERVVDGSVAV